MAEDEEYVPTLGDYADVIEWFDTDVHLPVPAHLERAYRDAVHRASLRRVAQMMSETYGT